MGDTEVDERAAHPRQQPGDRDLQVHQVAAVPGTWQMILGAALLLTILFVPQGIGGLIFRRRRALGAKQ